jgi:hypothetical protein
VTPDGAVMATSTVYQERRFDHGRMSCDVITSRSEVRMAEDEPTYDGPEFDMWLHLASGLDAAQMELDVLDEQSRNSLQWLARTIILGRDQLAVRRTSMEGKLLLADEVLLSDKWIRFAVELTIAERGIERSSKALKRFQRLRPTVTLRSMPLRAERYVREVIETFAFGFDAACIALSCSALEQLLKEELVRVQEYTEPQLRREVLTAKSLIAKAKQRNIISGSVPAAERLAAKRNNVMHKHLYDERVSEQQALDAIEELLEVVAEVLGRESEPG